MLGLLFGGKTDVSNRKNQASHYGGSTEYQLYRTRN